MQGTVLSAYDTLMSEDPCYHGGYVLLVHITSLSMPIIHTRFSFVVLVTNGFLYLIFILQIDSYLHNDQESLFSVYYNVEYSAGGWGQK